MKMASLAKTALVAGSTGLIGQCLLRRLIHDQRYSRIVALTRRPLLISHPKLQVVTADLHVLSQAIRELQADDWYCAIGTTIKQAKSQEAFRSVDYEYPLALAKQAVSSGAAQFLLVSAMGASAESSIFYSRVKGEIERDLMALQLPKLHLFRPSLLLGERAELRRGELIGAIVMRGIHPLLFGPLRKYRAIEGDAVAAAMIKAANTDHDPGIYVYPSDKIAQMARV
jgi:uncharacterized protein YbjT (DUF2867 family)